MRFVNFQLLSYPFLPKDFAETHESVWVTVDPKLCDGEVVHRCYMNTIDVLLEAGRLGFDALAVNEHHNNAYGMTPSPNLMAAMLARESSNVAVTVLGNSLALYNPAIRVAEEMAMLDVISNGRLIAGFPVGTSMDGPFSYSMNPSELRARYLEANELITKAWTTDSVFEWNGRFNKLRYVNPWPRPIQKPHPPVWVPGAGSPETWDFCCENDYVYAYLTFASYYKVKNIVDGYWARVDAHGLDRNPFRAAVATMVAIGDSYADAKEMYSEAADYFFNRCLHVNPRFAAAPGYLSEATIRKVLASQEAQAKTSNLDLGGAGFDEFVERGDLIAGDPDTVTEKLAELAKNSNVGNIVLVSAFGNMSRELAIHNTRMFATKVMPNLQPMFEDEWEHRWWPQNLADRPNLELSGTHEEVLT